MSLRMSGPVGGTLCRPPWGTFSCWGVGTGASWACGASNGTFRSLCTTRRRTYDVGLFGPTLLRRGILGVGGIVNPIFRLSFASHPIERVRV